eukprot:5458780-Amphidinium_carterae.2
MELVGAWFTAPPSEYEDKGIPSPLCRVAHLARLRQPLMPMEMLFARRVPTMWTASSRCSLCNTVCGGERAVRHNGDER